MVESARFAKSLYASKRYRGFESLSLRHFKWATSLIAGRSYHDYATLKRGNSRSALPRSIICSNSRGSFSPGSSLTVDSIGSGA